MIRASTSESICRRKIAAALVGGGAAVAALTTVGVFAASGGFDRFALNGGVGSGQSSPQVLRNGAIHSLRPTSTTARSVSPSIASTPSISELSSPSPPSLQSSASPNPKFTGTENPGGTESDLPTNVPGVQASLEPMDYPTATKSDPPTNVPGVPVNLEPTEYPTATKIIPPTDAPGVPTSLESTDYPTATESNIPTNGSGAPSSLEPTEYPTVTKRIFPTNVSEFPSTRSLLTNMTNATNVPTATPTISSNPTDESSKGTFRIRMHWQPGYMWQEVPDEGWFCLACAKCDLQNEYHGLKGCDIEPYTSCSSNMHLALTGCDPARLGPSKLAEIASFKFLFDDVPQLGLDGDQIQVAGTNLCIQVVLPGGTGSIELRECDSSLREQRIWGARPVGQAMELLPLMGNSGKCLSNHHHPRQAEQVYAEDCDLARLPDTSLWCPFFPEHDKIGTCGVVTASPTNKPTRSPVTSKPSTTRPTRTPTSPPTSRPTKFPTVPPTSRPTKFPTLPPSSRPTKFPTVPPTSRPTKVLLFN